MTENMKHSAMILGEVASSGAARGPAFVCACVEPTTVPRRVINESETQKEMEKLDAAISEAEKELLDLQEKVQQKAGKRQASLFEAQILLLHDLSLREEDQHPLPDRKNQRGGRSGRGHRETDVLVCSIGRPLLSRAGGGLARCWKTAARHSNQMPTIGDPQHS